MIEAWGLTRHFAAATAVADLSLRVADGAILALLGPNGAGKTTTVRMLAGLLVPTAGRAVVAGYDVRREPLAVRARVGLVTDAPGLYERMTAPAYLDLFGALYGMPPPDRARRIAALLALLELEAHRRERMAGFSKGMKQKVALARALLHDPPVLFLDEPTSGLDPLAARTVRALITDLKAANRSIVLCTHDLDEAERLADEVAILRAGRLVRRAAPAALRAQAARETLVRVALAAPCPGALAAAGIDGVAALRSVPAGATDGAGAPGRAPLLEYRTADPEAVNPEVLARLVAAGARVVSITCEAPVVAGADTGGGSAATFVRGGR